MIEHWRPIPGWEGQYSVSDQGRVRSEARTIQTKDGRARRIAERILRPNRHPSGRLMVDLGTTYRSAKIHRLVLAAFVGPCPEGMQVCHWDDNPSNNNLSNLRYGTQSDNAQDALRNGVHPTGSKTRCLQGHSFSAENTYIHPDSGYRACRTCRNERSRAKRAQADGFIPRGHAQTTCRRGHDWTDLRNVYTTRGVRRCAECIRIGAKARYQTKVVAS